MALEPIAPVGETLPFAWLEKISLLLLAAHLETKECQVGLSVPPKPWPHDAARVIDWAAAVHAVRKRGSPYGPADRQAQRIDYLTARDELVDRGSIAAELKGFLEEAVRRDRLYRYDGIWHDNGGNIDLVASSAAGLLVVEGKGVTRKKTDIDWARAACDTLSAVDRTLSWSKQLEVRSGVLLPDDRKSAPTGKGFVSTLLRVWPAGESTDETHPIFLVSREGFVTEHTVSALTR